MIPLTAMKQALEALVHWSDARLGRQGRAAITDLRAAIAELEQAEPVAYVCGTYAGRFIVGPVNGVTVLPDGMALYAAPPAPAIPAGWKLVPEEPTAEMKEFICDCYRDNGITIDCYAAMLAAAPQPPKE